MRAWARQPHRTARGSFIIIIKLPPATAVFKEVGARNEWVNSGQKSQRLHFEKRKNRTLFFTGILTKWQPCPCHLAPPYLPKVAVRFQKRKVAPSSNGFRLVLFVRLFVLFLGFVRILSAMKQKPFIIPAPVIFRFPIFRNSMQFITPKHQRHALLTSLNFWPVNTLQTEKRTHKVDGAQCNFCCCNCSCFMRSEMCIYVHMNLLIICHATT